MDPPAQIGQTGQTGLMKFIARSLMFLYVIFVGVFQLLNLGVSAKSFFDNYSDGKSRLQISNDYGIELLLKTEDKYVVIYKCYLIAMIVFAVLSVMLNRSLFKLMTAVLFGVIAFVTYNPLLPNNVVASNNLYGLRHELIISFGIIIGIVVNMFLPNNIEPQVKEQSEDKKEVKQEIEMSEVRDKNNKSSSGKKAGNQTKKKNKK